MKLESCDNYEDGVDDDDGEKGVGGADHDDEVLVLLLSVSQLPHVLNVCLMLEIG